MRNIPKFRRVAPLIMSAHSHQPIAPHAGRNLTIRIVWLAPLQTVGLTGIEPATSASRTQESAIANSTIEGLAATSANGCTNGCTSDADLDQITTELQSVIDAWPSLSESTSTAILAMIQTGGD
jgi:hypothetical protein